MAIVQRALRAELAQDVVGDTMGELEAIAAVGEQAAKRADDRIDGLTAERRQAVDQRDLAAEPRRLERGRNTGDAGAEHADVGGDRFRPRLRRAPHNPRRGGKRCVFGMVRAHIRSPP